MVKKVQLRESYGWSKVKHFINNPSITEGRYIVETVRKGNFGQLGPLEPWISHFSEPNTQDENCAEMLVTEGGGWNDAPCDWNQPAICEKKGDKFFSQYDRNVWSRCTWSKILS